MPATATVQRRAVTREDREEVSAVETFGTIETCPLPRFSVRFEVSRDVVKGCQYMHLVGSVLRRECAIEVLRVVFVDVTLLIQGLNLRVLEEAILEHRLVNAWAVEPRRSHEFKEGETVIHSIGATIESQGGQGGEAAQGQAQATVQGQGTGAEAARQEAARQELQREFASELEEGGEGEEEVAGQDEAGDVG